jgi:hypothetical protein
MRCNINLGFAYIVNSDSVFSRFQYSYQAQLSTIKRKFYLNENWLHREPSATINSNPSMRLA